MDPLETSTSKLVVRRATNWTIESAAIGDSIGIACLLSCEW
jgi:hypothetical protein